MDNDSELVNSDLDVKDKIPLTYLKSTDSARFQVAELVSNVDSTSSSPKFVNKRKRLLISPKRDNIPTSTVTLTPVPPTTIISKNTTDNQEINNDIEIDNLLHPQYHHPYSFLVFLAQLMTLWEILCATVLFIYFLEFFDVFTPSRIVCNVTDIVFFMDVLLRYLVARIKNRNATITTTNLIQQQDINNNNNNWLFIWFLIDLCLSIPYGTLIQNFEVLPVFKIIEIKNNNRRPIIKFFTNKSFRKELFSHLKEHFIQRKTVRNILSYLSIIKKDRFGLRRIGRIFGLYRIPSRMKMLKKFLENSRQMSWILTSLRGLSFVLRSHLLPTPPPSHNHDDVNIDDNSNNNNNNSNKNNTYNNNYNNNNNSSSSNINTNTNTNCNNNSIRVDHNYSNKNTTNNTSNTTSNIITTQNNGVTNNSNHHSTASSNIRAYTAGILASTSTGNISSSLST